MWVYRFCCILVDLQTSVSKEFRVSRSTLDCGPFKIYLIITTDEYVVGGR